jgi:hypothetical protein
VQTTTDATTGTDATVVVGEGMRARTDRCHGWDRGLLWVRGGANGNEEGDARVGYVSRAVVGRE